MKVKLQNKQIYSCYTALPVLTFDKVMNNISVSDSHVLVPDVSTTCRMFFHLVNVNVKQVNMNPDDTQILRLSCSCTVGSPPLLTSLQLCGLVRNGAAESDVLDLETLV